MINDGQEPLHFYMADTNSPLFEAKQTLRTKKKKPRGPAFTQFEGVLLVECWLATSMDRQKKAPNIGKENHKLHHEQKHHMMPHSVASGDDTCSLQHRWSTIQENVSKIADFLKQVVDRNQSGIGVQSHATLAASLHHQTEKKPFTMSHYWMKLNGN